MNNDTEMVPTETEAPALAPVQKNGASKKKAKKVVKTKAASKKAGAKKPAKKTAKKVAASGSPQAQSGPALNLPFEKMNKVEQKIVKAAFPKNGKPELFSIKDLMKAVGVKASSPVRNGLRRPVRGKWLEKADRGKYRITKAGLKRGIPQGA